MFFRSQGIRFLVLVLCPLGFLLIKKSLPRTSPFLSSALHPVVENCAPVPANCSWRFLTYKPSPWETEWSTNVEEWQNSISSVLEKQADKALKLIQQVVASSEDQSFSGDDELFSRLVFVNEAGQVGEQLIEPLVGMLRDPLLLLNKPMPVFSSPLMKDPTQSKRFLMALPFAPYRVGSAHFQASGLPPWYSQSCCKGQPRQRILIDLGSSNYLGWGQLTEAHGARWFVERFRKVNMGFDRIFAFEFAKLDPHSFWNEIPDDLVPNFTLVNHGVEKEPTSKFNPWNTLRAVARPCDFVVVKLDIDTSDIENSLIAELASNQDLMARIDEMFFEHHTNVPEMHNYWGKPAALLPETYRYFTTLRAHGIRMHSWP